MADPSARTRSPDAVGAVDRARARSFVDEHVVPRADEYDQSGRIPEDLIAAVSEAGLWAPFLPQTHGGSGLDLLTLGHVHEEVGRGCSSLRSMMTVHTMLAWAVNRWGTPEQRAEWAPRLASGEALGAFCLTEPEVGSDAVNIAATAIRKGGDWVLNGVKTWITSGQRADVFLVFAKTERGIGAFLVPRETPGVRIIPIDDMLGTRASMLARVEFRDVQLGPDALLGPDGFASGMVMTGVLDLGRYSVAAGSVGIVQACLDACAEHTSRRTVGAQPLRSLQLIQAKVTDMVTDVRAARLLCEHAGKLKDDGDPSTINATWVAKYFASRAAARHAAEAVQIHGASGCGPGHPAARYYRDAKVMEIIEGSTEIQRITIAQQAYQGAAS